MISGCRHRFAHFIPILALLAIISLPLLGTTPREEALDWVSDHALQILSTEPNAPFDDLECLRDLIGDARIVALGEQTHGTHEFQTMKHRIIRFLVEEMGFTSVGLEASWGGGLSFDSFVLEGKGTQSDAHSRMGFWFFQTVDFHNLVSWMRMHNTDTPESPVHLVGFDIQSPHRALEWCERTLSSAGYSFSRESRQGLWRLDSLASKLWRDESARRDFFSLAQVFLTEMLEALPTLESKLTELQVMTLHRISRAIEQREGSFDPALMAEELNDAGWRAEGYSYRDRCMAENVAWWLDALGDGAKMILWAHNGHVAASWEETGAVPMGENLETQFGNDFVTIGFSTGRGSFYAVNKEIGAFDDLTIPSPIPNSYEWTFSKTAIPAFILDLRELDQGSSVDAWMSTSRPFKVLGNSPDIENGILTSAFGMNAVLPDMFDIVIHIEETTPVELDSD